MSRLMYVLLYVNNILSMNQQSMEKNENYFQDQAAIGDLAIFRKRIVWALKIKLGTKMELNNINLCVKLQLINYNC